jgi:glucose/arabinose dehydrogenase
MKILPRFRFLCQLEGWARSVRNLACLALLTFTAISLAAAQQPAPGSAAQPPVAKMPATAVPTADTSKPTTPQKTPQQKQLADDTAKLLTLANELKVELDKSSKDTLSLSVIRKAEQVEKLAHKVRDEMKASQQN